MPTVASLPKYIPLAEAATQLSIDVAKLHDMAASGRIEAIRLPDGGLAVNEEVVEKPLRKEDLDEYKQFAHLAVRRLGSVKHLEIMMFLNLH